MKKQPLISSRQGLSILEMIVAVVIVLILAAALVLPDRDRGGLSRSPIAQVLVNMKQLHLATQQMALDGTTTGDTNIGWPGDTGGSFAVWATNLVGGNYLTTNDLCKLLSAAGRIAPFGHLPLTNNSAVLVYNVQEKSPTNTVFLTTANFTNTPTGGAPLLAEAKPYGKKGFVLFHRGGDGAVLTARQTGPDHTNIIGAYVPLCR